MIKQLLLLIMVPTICLGMGKQKIDSGTEEITNIMTTAKLRDQIERSDWPDSTFKQSTYTRETFQWLNHYNNTENEPAIDFTTLALPEEFYRGAWYIADEGRILANSLEIPGNKSIQEVLWELKRPTLNAEILAASIQSLLRVEQHKARSLSVKAFAILLKTQLNLLAISSFMMDSSIQAKIVAGNLASLWDPMQRWPLAKSLEVKLEFEFKENERLLFEIETAQENIPTNDL